MVERPSDSRQAAYRSACVALYRLLSLRAHCTAGERTAAPGVLGGAELLLELSHGAADAIREAIGDEHGLVLQERDSTLTCSGLWLRPWVAGFVAQEHLVTTLQSAGIGELLIERGVRPKDLIGLADFLVAHSREDSGGLDSEQPDLGLIDRGVQHVHVALRMDDFMPFPMAQGAPVDARSSGLRTVYVAEWLLRSMDPKQHVYPEFPGSDSCRGAIYALADRFVDEPVFLHLLEGLPQGGPGLSAGTAALLWTILLCQRLGMRDEMVLQLASAALVHGIVSEDPDSRAQVEQHLLLACADSPAAGRCLLALDPGGGLSDQDQLMWLIPALTLARSFGSHAVAALGRSAGVTAKHLIDELDGILDQPCTLAAAGVGVAVD